MNRLDFIKTSVLGTAGLLLAPGLIAAESEPMKFRKWIENDVTCIKVEDTKLSFYFNEDSSVVDYYQHTHKSNILFNLKKYVSNWVILNRFPSKFGTNHIYLEFEDTQQKIDFINQMYPGLNAEDMGTGSLRITRYVNPDFSAMSMEQAFKLFKVYCKPINKSYYGIINVSSL